jgi:bifunctional non-homologous end joining protein LigD
VVVGWTDPEGSRPFIGALLLGYYSPDGRFVYAGRVGSGMRADQLADVWKRLQLLRTDKMPLDAAPPRATRFGRPWYSRGPLGSARTRCRGHVSDLGR